MNSIPRATEPLSLILLHLMLTKWLLVSNDPSALYIRAAIRDSRLSEIKYGLFTRKLNVRTYAGPTSRAGTVPS